MVKTFNNILIPYDGSSTGIKAFNTALRLAKDLDATITVLAYIKEQAKFGFFSTKSEKNTIRKKKTQAEKTISAFKEKATKKGVSFKSKIVICTVSSKYVVSYVNDHKIDLIVMKKSKSVSPKSLYHTSSVNYVDDKVKCSILSVR